MSSTNARRHSGNEEQPAPPFIDWRNSRAKEIILCDLEDGLLSIEEHGKYGMSAEKAWKSVYSKLEEFKNVPFRQFEVRLRDHREQIKRRLECSK